MRGKARVNAAALEIVLDKKHQECHICTLQI